MTWNQWRRLTIGLAGTLSLPLLAAAQESPNADVAPAATVNATVFEDEGKIADVWEVYNDLGNRERLYRSVRWARSLLAEANAAIPDAAWDQTLETLHELDYPAKPRSGPAQLLIAGKVDLALSTIQHRLLQTVPELAAYDFPNDDGLALRIAWWPRSDAGAFRVERKEVTDAEPDGGDEWELIAVVDGRAIGVTDEHKLRGDRRYQYRVSVLRTSTEGAPAGAPLAVLTSNTTQTQGQWVHSEKVWFFLFMVVICAAVVFYIEQVKSGKDIYIRKIAGLEAVDEAVGRATEMGRPIMFVPGIQDITDIQTVAGLIILGRVAKTAAEHDATLEVPTARSLVMTTARETVKTSFANAGRPDAYDEKRIYYTTDEQFGYVAAVTGAMVREEPAACFYMGAFYAESLILAETANTTGSIQIAGTAMPAQLPFFVAACDYTLIGEEFFAASAYLSGEPHQLGSLKGQDMGKIIVAAFIVVGVFLSTVMMVAELRYSAVGAVLDFIRETLLNTAE